MSLIINIKVADHGMEEVALAYGFYYGNFLTTDNQFMKKIHGQIVQQMDSELAKLMGKEQLVEMKASIIEDLEKNKYILADVAKKTKQMLQKQLK